MSEPTPLTAALERAISARLLERPPTDPGEFPEFVAHVRAQLGYKDATIDAQATEIAALKGALENLMDEQNGPPLIRDAASWQVVRLATQLRAAEQAVEAARELDKVMAEVIELEDLVWGGKAEDPLRTVRAALAEYDKGPL